jgi:DNA polymerase-3 subunit alpha
VVTGLQRKFTKKGDPMGAFVLEDLQDTVEVTLFPRVMMEQGYKLADDAIVLVKARVDRRDELPKLICMDITPFEGFAEGAPPLRISLPATALSDDRIGRLKSVLAEHPGESPVFLHLGQGTVLRLPDQHRVDLGRVVGELRVAFGHEAVLL